MPFAHLLQSVDELIYQIVMLIVLAPKTFLRVLADPTWASRYCDAELRKDAAERFDAYTPPALFWGVIGVAPYLMLIEFLARLPGSRVAQEAEWTAFSAAPWEQRFAVVVSVAVAIPMAFSLRMLRGLGMSASRSALRRPFYVQCYVLCPAFVILLPAV